MSGCQLLEAGAIHPVIRRAKAQLIAVGRTLPRGATAVRSLPANAWRSEHRADACFSTGVPDEVEPVQVALGIALRLTSK
jgi:hypothetical protein